MTSPSFRASDEDRERVAVLLREHYGAGRLSADDLSDRLEAAYAARTDAELAELTADLPAEREQASRARSGPPADLRGHFTVYALVNLMLIGIWAASGGGYFWPIWPMLGWGLGVALHAVPWLTGRQCEAPEGASDRRQEARAPARDTLHTSVHEMASAVTSERPSLRPGAAPDGTVTILFTDIEGSTKLNDRLGDLRWVELLRVHHAIVREQVDAHGGFEVKAQGDGFMITFPSARRALECSAAIQRAIGERLDDHPDGPIRVRIGLHTGEAVRQESDFYGKNVVVAARIADRARGGEILASSVVKQLTESAGDIRFEQEREVELEGLAGRQLVYRVELP
ncbi:MAG TPA: adenylate/guanylate cyclase domain-containing protein [Thermoleophilaceae bacterium]|nr:adenylate/guanylate cyclase domain-containing protein [Thermoleophilaceae bacterium]